MTLMTNSNSQMMIVKVMPTRLRMSKMLMLRKLMHFLHQYSTSQALEEMLQGQNLEQDLEVFQSKDPLLMMLMKEKTGKRKA